MDHSSDTEEIAARNAIPSYWTLRRHARAHVEQSAVDPSSSPVPFQHDHEEDCTLLFDFSESSSSGFHIGHAHDDEIHVDDQDRSEQLGDLPDETEHEDGEVDQNETPDLFTYDKYLELSSSDCDSDEDEPSDEDLQSELKGWALDNKIPLQALSSLLPILHKSHPNLPKDPRTLLKTVKEYDVKDVCDGQYHHFGVETSILKQLASCETDLNAVDVINIQINIDGLPLFKSSNGQFWPILGLIENISNQKEPQIYGLYYGQSKPSCIHEFLHDFVTEMKYLEQVGVTFGGKHFSVVLSKVICDAPAAAFVKNIKGHTGYFGCGKCVQEGHYLQNRMTFPETNASLRTDSEFHEMGYEDHQHGPSPLTQLHIGMVTCFPLDYMHLVCLGVTRRLLLLWLKGPLQIRIGTGIRNTISEKLIELREHIPKEFARKPRSLKDLERWKATELRFFLLYCGPLVLEDNLQEKVYKNFLVLHAAIRVLVSSSLCQKYCDYANELLIFFIEEFAKLYGPEHVVYNIHGLSHLAADVQKYGPLDGFSAFPFENFLGHLKKLVRKPNFPLQQIVKRISEFGGMLHTVKKCKKLGLGKQHSGGPVPVGYSHHTQFKEVYCHNYVISIGKGNNCVGVDGKVVLVRNVLAADGENFDQALVVYEAFRFQKEYYSYPLQSTSLGVFSVECPDGLLKVAPAMSINQKYVLLPRDVSRNAYVACAELES